MINWPFVVAVLLTLAVAGWVVRRRRSRAGVAGATSSARGTSGPVEVARGWVREAFTGLDETPASDVVEAMARCLAEATKRMGSIYSVPGWLGVMLPVGLYRAARAACLS